MYSKKLNLIWLGSPLQTRYVEVQSEPLDLQNWFRNLTGSQSPDRFT